MQMNHDLLVILHSCICVVFTYPQDYRFPYKVSVESVLIKFLIHTVYCTISSVISLSSFSLFFVVENIGGTLE